MNDFIIITAPQTEAQKNESRASMLRVAKRYPKWHKSRELILKQIAKSYDNEYQMLHITNEQLKLIVDKVNERLEDQINDVDESQFGIDIIGNGLDAILKFVAYSKVLKKIAENDSGQKTDYNDVIYTIYNAKLETYIDREEIPNDANGLLLGYYITQHIN